MKNKALRDLASLAMLSLLLTMVVLAFSTSIYRLPMFISYFVMPTVLLMNWLPIALVMGLFYAATGRGWVAFALTSLLVAPLMLVNYYKLLLRNDPLLFADLKLTTEAATMSEEEQEKSPWRALHCGVGDTDNASRKAFGCRIWIVGRLYVRTQARERQK